MASPVLGSFGVFVDLSTRPERSPEPVYVGPLRALETVGIVAASPGTYATACAKGFGPERAPCPVRKVTLARPGLDVFVFESAAWLLHYADGRWTETAISD